MNEKGDAVFTRKVSCTTANQKLNMLTSRNEVLVVADADCFINFDSEVTATERLLLKANVPYKFGDIMVTNLHYLGVSGGENIYVMAWKSAR